MDAYPFDLLPPASERWLLDGVLINGGIPVERDPVMSRTDAGGFWRCWMNDIELVTRAQIKAARALETVLDMGASSIIVPAFDWAFSPEYVLHEDGAPFSDGAPYQFSPITATTTAAASRRATILDAAIEGGFDFEAGERFSITHPTWGKRLYSVGRILSVSGTSHQFAIRPPLREAIDTATTIDFSNPGCVMRLDNPRDFLGAIDPLHESMANAVWREARPNAV